MIIKHHENWMEKEHSVTDERLYQNRRQFISNAAAGTIAGVGGLGLLTASRPTQASEAKKLSFTAEQDPAALALRPEQTSFDAVTGYNNFYEFGMGKGDPAKYASRMTTDPWSVKIGGMVDKPVTMALEDLIDFSKLEERIYRLRCVEAWSMVIPWIGIPLRDVINKLPPPYQPQSGANYVAFETLARRSEMRGLKWPTLDWPYREGLRMDEAMHPLTLLAVGVYGQTLPNQNGAPLRLVVPWKYGFKSIKSIVGIRFTARQPKTSWNMSAPREYGFYSNVNPTVDHPRWSQSSERRIGEWGRRETLMFNGYSDQVADLYKGMDLKRNY